MHMIQKSDLIPAAPKEAPTVHSVSPAHDFQGPPKQ